MPSFDEDLIFEIDAHAIQAWEFIRIGKNVGEILKELQTICGVSEETLEPHLLKLIEDLLAHKLISPKSY